MREAQRTGRLHLPLGHGLDARADRLRHVRGRDETERERDLPVRAAGDLRPGERQRHGDAHEDEDQQGGQPAEDLDVDAGQPAVRADRGEPHQRDDHTEGEAEDETGHRVEDGVLQRQRDDVREHPLGQVDLGELVLQLLPVGRDAEGDQGGDEHRVLDAARHGPLLTSGQAASAWLDFGVRPTHEAADGEAEAASSSYGPIHFS
jgi:hypothetical protein